MSTRAEYDYEINDLKKNSNDLYNSMKLLYHQRRMGGINEDHLKDLPVPKIYID
jgi:ABC-type transporter lipoprotein component MlaA